MKLFVALFCTATMAFSSPARIVGGQEAAKNQFPYQVSIRAADGAHDCGGSILDNRTILTAAHCVRDSDVNALFVMAGDNNLHRQKERFQVAKIITYDRTGFNTNDIAILKLNEVLEFNEAIQAVKLPSKDIPDGSDVTLSGWGANSDAGDMLEDLQFIHLKTISNKECQEKLERDSISKSQVCTYTKVDEGACYGDSGGPLVNGSGEQVGIVSMGYPCAIGLPDIYTRVYSYLDWIENNRY